jgi:hypothetical protein
MGSNTALSLHKKNSVSTCSIATHPVCIHGPSPDRVAAATQLTTLKRPRWNFLTTTQGLATTTLVLPLTWALTDTRLAEAESAAAIFACEPDILNAGSSVLLRCWHYRGSMRMLQHSFSNWHPALC